MSVITLFSGKFCNREAVVKDIANASGYRIVTDQIIAGSASELSGIPEKKIFRAFSSKTSVFNQFTFEKERSIAYLRLAAAKILGESDLIFSGFCGLLVPRRIAHVFRVCLTAGDTFQNQAGQSELNLSEDEAGIQVKADRRDQTEWVRQTTGYTDPWDANLYDMIIPMDNTQAPEASSHIRNSLLKEAFKVSEDSLAATQDFKLAADVETKLAEAGHSVGVEASDGKIQLIINQKVLMLNRLEKELKSIIDGVPGIASVETLFREPDHEAPAYRKYNYELPSKVLLVDDEKEFVQTLSERLQMRDMGTVVAYDGPSALDLVRNDDPEVMIVDLKMPGVDGMEILDQVKQIKPEIEVVIMTGHGSELDKETCLDLGAFAYMQKPVDINTLSEILKQAHEKIRAGQ